MADSKKRFERHDMDDDKEWGRKIKNAGGRHSHINKKVDDEFILEEAGQYEKDIEYFMKKWK